MRLIRGLLAVVLWLVALVVLLVALLLCVTVIGLPIGLPLLNYARRMFGAGLRLMTSRKVTHPVQEMQQALAGESGHG
ncbi:MAG: hypothetical protein QOE01_1904 [Actinomycetota bacterium]|jgi:uncharacterized membrane protein YccF (DUF307 family)|nr:hypothetical protein [Actinomycetota bacterium]